MSILKQRVMRRVYAIWALRKIFSPGMVKMYLVAVFLWELGRQVFVAEIFSNSPRLIDVGESAQFFVSAFTGTNIVVQGIVVALLVIATLLTKDFVASVRSYRSALFAGGR